MSEWHRFHPLTPYLRGGVMTFAVLGWVVSQQLDRLFGAQADDPTEGHLRIAALGIVVVIAVAILLGWISWRAARYRLGTSTLELKSGVVFRQHRQVRYDRIQAVEINRPVLARLAGLSAVKVEAAGGLESNINLAYLATGHALAIRADLLARARAREVPGQVMPPQQWPAAGPEPQPAGGSGPGPGRLGIPTGADDLIPGARMVAAIPAGRVWAATGFSGATLFLIPAIPLLLYAFIDRSLGVLPWLGPMVIGLAGQQFGRLTSWMNFRVLATDDALLVRHGLTELRSATIPLRRVQAVQVQQPALWRFFGWWRVEVNVAGTLRTKEKEQTALIPIGTREEVLRVLAAMGPSWSLPEVVEGMEAPGLSPNFVPSPPSARWLDPLSWRRTGYAVTPAALITRGGWLGRHTQLVPHARVQSLQLSQGPLERRLGLGNVDVHSTTGPVSPGVRHLAIADATRLLEEQMLRCAAARAADFRPAPRPTQGVDGALSSPVNGSATVDHGRPPRME